MDEISNCFTEEIVCPNCGYELQDSNEYVDTDGDIGLLDCPRCNAKFYAYRNIEITYSTEKPVRGICKKCGKENTILESYHGTFGSFKDYCLDCKEKEEERLRKEYMNKIIKSKEE